MAMNIETDITLVDLAPPHLNAARRYVASIAIDVDDCRELLAMLGLAKEGDT